MSITRPVRMPLLILLSLAILTMPAAAQRICNVPEGMQLPPGVLESMRKSIDPEAPAYGWSRLAGLTRQNRLDLEAGRITAAEATARGGTKFYGEKGVIVFPVLFANTPGEPFDSARLQEQFFDGPWTDGTLAEYYREVSYNNLYVYGHVDDWYQLEENDTYYEGSSNGLHVWPYGGDAHTGDLIWEVLEARDPDIDFSDYDNDGPDGVPNSADDDGWVDFIVFLQPEVDHACNSNPASVDNIHSHQFILPAWIRDFVTDDVSNSATDTDGFIGIYSYFICSAVNCEGDGQGGIGTFAHEFGHALGIADLYDTNYNSEGIGFWGLMGAGAWNTMDHPAHMTAWTKNRLGWLSYHNVNYDTPGLCIGPVELEPVAVRLWTHGSASKEYFLVENRQPIGFDVDLMAPGLVVYHVDENIYDQFALSNTANYNEAHKALDVECADATSGEHEPNVDDLDDGTNRGDAGDVWCPATQATFDRFSVPDSRNYSNFETGVAVRNINTCGGSGQWICADYEVGSVSTASICIRDCEDDGCAPISNCGSWWASPDLWIDNEGDGQHSLPAEGITNKLWYRIHNLGPEALGDVTISLYYGDPAMGQLWPGTAASLIATETVSLLGTGTYDTWQGWVEFVYPPPPAQIDHYCLGAVISHPLDPQSSEFAPNDNNVAQINEQILIAQAGGKAKDCPGPFLKETKVYLHDGYNPLGGLVEAEVRIGTPPHYGDYELPANWTLSILPNTGPFLLSPGEPDEIIVRLESDNASHGQRALIPLTLVRVHDDVPYGGITIDCTIDCAEPRAPIDNFAEWVPWYPDYMVGARIKVTWNHVTMDVDDGDERIKYYQVWRGAESSPFMTHVTDVAVDAEPEEPGFQWFDSFWPDCPETYRYRIRPVDGAMNYGAMSDYIELPCEDLGTVPGAVPDVVRLEQNVPNPFNPETIIRYSLPGAAAVQLRVYDVSGRLVRVLRDGAVETPGDHEAGWDGCDERGRSLESGVYFYRLMAGEVSETRKMVLLK